MKPSLQKPAQASPLNFSPLGGGGTADLVSAFAALREEVALLRAEVSAQRDEIALLRAAITPSRPAACVHFYIKKYCCPEKLEIS